MSAVLLLLARAVLGAIASLAGAVYQDRWKTTAQRHRRMRRAKAIARASIVDEGPITIAGNLTTVYLVEGDGEMVLEAHNITVSSRSVQAPLPELIAMNRDRVKRQLAASSQRAGQKVFSWNSSTMIALNDYKVSRSSPREEPVIRLETSATDYATFAATVLQLDTEIEKPAASRGPVLTTIRREYFPTAASISQSVRHPLPFLANGLGIMLLGFTDDRKVLLGRRHLESRARPGERDVSVVEGMDSHFDLDGSGHPNPYVTGVRGCKEELGITVDAADVSILGFAVDMTYYQWNFLGIVETRCAAGEVLASHALHAKDRWEEKIEPVDLEPARIFERLRQDKIWDLGLAAIYLALCKKCGAGPVRRAADSVFGPIGQRPRWRR